MIGVAGIGSSLTRPCTVTGDGEGLVSHAGIAWLAETADLAGWTAGLSAAMAAVPQRQHDPGRTLAQMILALADGATCLSDLAAVRSQRSMFGAVASEATVWRTFDPIGPVELRGIAAARQAARERAWSAGAGPAGDDLIIDFDVTLTNTPPSTGSYVLDGLASSTRGDGSLMIVGIRVSLVINQDWGWT